MKRIIILSSIFLFSFSCSMEQPTSLVQRIIQNYQPRGIYVGPMEAVGMVNLLEKNPELNSLCPQEKSELETASRILKKPFLNDLAQTITVESADGKSFAIPFTTAQKSGFFSPIIKNYSSLEKIPVPIESISLDLYAKACWFEYYTSSLFWMRNTGKIKDNQIDDLLATADYFLDDFVEKTMNDCNRR